MATGPLCQGLGPSLPSPPRLPVLIQKAKQAGKRLGYEVGGELSQFVPGVSGEGFCASWETSEAQALTHTHTHIHPKTPKQGWTRTHAHRHMQGSVGIRVHSCEHVSLLCGTHTHTEAQTHMAHSTRQHSACGALATWGRSALSKTAFAASAAPLATGWLKIAGLESLRPGRLSAGSVGRSQLREGVCCSTSSLGWLLGTHCLLRTPHLES